MRITACLTLIGLGLSPLSACSPDKPIEISQPTSPVSAPAELPPAATPVTLPVSLNAVMVALVDHASEPLWLDAYEAPKTTDRWLETEYNAYQMAVSGKLIQLPGTGPNDATWVAAPEWKMFADEMSAAGMDALAAAQAKDVSALNIAGDRLVASCETCHKKFKGDLPSMAIYKSPNYPPR